MTRPTLKVVAGAVAGSEAPPFLSPPTANPQSVEALGAELDQLRAQLESKLSVSVGIEYCTVHHGTRNEDSAVAWCEWADRALEDAGTAACVLRPLFYEADGGAVVALRAARRSGRFRGLTIKDFVSGKVPK